MTTTDMSTPQVNRKATTPGLAHSVLVAAIALALWAAFVARTMKDQDGGILLGM